MKKVLLASIAALMLAAPLVAQPRHFVLVRPAFGWGWGSPYWGAYPYYGYPYGYGYYAGPQTGEVKFDTKDKDTQVFINDAYAGTVGKLKKLELRPGPYNIELRGSGQPTYAEKIYVVAGKTLHLKPDVESQER